MANRLRVRRACAGCFRQPKPDEQFTQTGHIQVVSDGQRLSRIAAWCPDCLASTQYRMRVPGVRAAGCVRVMSRSDYEAKIGNL